MAADTSTPAVTEAREYGVRLRWPDEQDHTVVPFADRLDAEDELERLTDNGCTDAEIVSRPVSVWEIDGPGLVVTLWALARAHDLEAVGDATVRERLARWLPGRVEAACAEWGAAVKAAAELREVNDDGDRTAEVPYFEALLENAVRDVIGGARS